MPATFQRFGVHFLYPDNWRITEEIEEGAQAGVTLESPAGSFFSLYRYRHQTDPSALLEQAIAAMRGEYEAIEKRPYEDPGAFPDEAGCDLDFYCLDLLITARILAVPDQGDCLLVQMQGENREFDRLEPVFQAVLKTLRDHLQKTRENL
jgi:hypothetical protein